MKDGFLKVACVSPDLKVADCLYNAGQIKLRMEEAYNNGARVIVFPELAITGYTCNDLFLQETLLRGALDALKELKRESSKYDSLIFVGLPLENDGKLYNVAAALYKGKVLAFIPKYNIPNYGEFYEQRHFARGNKIVKNITFDGEQVPMGMNIL